MTCSEADHSAFYRHSSLNLSPYLIVYVDGVIITNDDQDGSISRLKISTD